MILVDTPVWIDHLRRGNAVLAGLLENNAVLAHPWVTGELALGNLTNRAEILALLRGLPQATLAEHDEVLLLIEQQALSGAGVGYVDAQLLAASRLTADAKLWTTEKRLGSIGARLGLEYQPAEHAEGRP